MNKDLIQEIEVQASEYAWNSLLAENETPAEIMREKFAELIIVKCIDICSDNHYMTAEVKASHEIKILADNAEDKHKKILLRISNDENKHANLLKSLCEKRGLSIAKESNDRYYNTVEVQALTQDELYAIGYYAEGMRLSRIRAICNDSEMALDIKESFIVILKDEIMHERAFGRIASSTSLVKMKNKHDLGVAALGLTLG